MITPSLWFGKPRKKFRVILKSGASFNVSATELNVKYKSDTMELTSYTFSNPKGETPFHVSPLEIAAILQIY